MKLPKIQVRVFVVQNFTLLFFLLFLFSKQSNAQIPANDNCAAATILTAPSLTCTNTNTTIFNATNQTPTGPCGGATATTTYDVWYRFTANGTSNIITLSNLGSSLNPLTTYVQVYSGACGGLSTVGSCQPATVPILTTGLTNAVQYYVRVYVTTAPTSGVIANWNFSICVTTATATNDICSNAVQLTSGGTTCNNTAGTNVGATVTGTDPGSGTCTGTILWDVWYKFIAVSANPTITISGPGGSFPTAANTKMQLLSGACGALTIVQCGSGSYTFAPTGLTPGTLYYVRLFSTVTAAPATNGGFNICITDVTQPNLCTNALWLTSYGGCTNTSGLLTGSTYTAGTGIPGCGVASRNDVWYKFVAQSTNPIITLNTGMANPRMTLFTGDCSGFTGSQCGTTSIVTNGLTIGDTLYIRVYTDPNVTGTFNICITDPARIVGAGNSYVNVSKKTVGGIVSPGDTLEIRSSYYWHGNYDASLDFSRARFYDSLPTKTIILPFVNPAGDTLLRWITNEGVTVTKLSYAFTPADDAGAYYPTPGLNRYQIRMNIGGSVGNAPTSAATGGNPTDVTGAGTINPNTTLPIAGGGTLITASYFVKVNGIVGDTIRLARSIFAYRRNTGSFDTTILGTPYKIIISPLDVGICPNSTGLNFASENAGTFGSGTSKERTTPLVASMNSYAWRSIVNTNLGLGDGFYSITNNLSPTGSIQPNANYQPNCGTPAPGYECANRMHGGFWEIMGDHTGTNDAIGNPAPAPGSTGGYMLAVNADYQMSDAFKQSIGGLCPNTYYQYSAWVRNVCKACGISSTGTSTYRPGVLPNLTFTVNGVDYYSSGTIDTVGWVRRGFIFRTGNLEDSIDITIRNNAPGGGGNDWVLDDIQIATCLPNMRYSPSASPNTCESNPLLITDTIRSFFNNYTNYKWQRSTDGGVNWVDIAGTTGVGVPVLISGSYEYVATYTVPPAFTTLVHNGDRYRVIVATTPANLTDANCQSSDVITLNLTVLDCGDPLAVSLLSFAGKLIDKKAVLNWSTSKEDEMVKFSLEKSNDGINFSSIATIDGYNNNRSEVNNYTFTDPSTLTNITYYRVILMRANGSRKYSKTIQLNPGTVEFGFGNVINPFHNQLDFELISSENTKVDAYIIDLTGKPVRKSSFIVNNGVTPLHFPGLESLPSGPYILQIVNKNVMLNRKVVKK